MQRQTDRLEAAFAREEARAQNASAPVLLAGIALITTWITVENGFPRALFFYPFMIGFAVISMSGRMLRHYGLQPWWEQYARYAVSVALLTLIIFTDNPFEDPLQTPAMKLRWQNEVYFFVLVAGATFTYSPRLVLWTGALAALAWITSALWITAMPGVFREISLEAWRHLSVEQRRLVAMDPNFVLMDGNIRVAVVLLVVSGTLAAFVRRSRMIVRRHADAERQRDNLSRYFSANVVEELAQQDDPLSVTRRQNAAVLFADIVGFTAMSASAPSETVIVTLRQYHRRTQDAVFAHAGTLEKFIGDEVMATFGTPRPGPTDASNALRCAQALIESVREWNALRRARGEAPVVIGIGVHYGTVVLGDIGGAQRLEFAVVGDTVNVASRLERLTRDLAVTVVVSGDAVDAVTAEGAHAPDLVPGLTEIEGRSLRGRAETTRLWVRGDAAAPHHGVP